ncbi:hypothetical protein P9112_004716 [Eukaryota sp. TZLM1-RC]
MQQGEKNDDEVTDPVHTFSFNLLCTEQKSSSPRTPQSETVILLYRNKRKVRVSISCRNRRSDPAVGVEYCTFLSHHVSNGMGAVESAMVIITLNMGCFCLCFVLYCRYFDVFDFIDFCGLGTCTVDLECCVLNLYFDTVEFDYCVYILCFQCSSFQHFLSTNPITVNLTMDGNVEANPGPRKRTLNCKSSPPSEIIRTTIFDQQTSQRKQNKQQKALKRKICIENTMLNIENTKILTMKQVLFPDKIINKKKKRGCKSFEKENW